MPLTSIAEFLDPANNHTSTTAERNLIAAARAGRDCILNGGTRPTAASDATQIRADLLRLLIVGGTTDCRLHESGVALMGGYITGTLDLRFAKARGQCVLNACLFVEEPNLNSAKFALFSLEDCQLPGLFALGMKTTGSGTCATSPPAARSM